MISGKGSKQHSLHLQIDFGQVIGDMLGDLMASVQPIEIKIFGSDQKTLNELAGKVAGEVEKIEGVEDVFDGVIIAGPSIEVIPDQQKLAQFKISPCFISVSASDNG